MAWSAFLADEDENGFHGWFDKAENRLETPTHAYRSTTPGVSDARRGRVVLEGTIDLISHFGRIPDRLFIAAAPYKSPEGGRLVAGSQVPAGNGDGDLEAQEFLSVNTRDLSVADP